MNDWSSETISKIVWGILALSVIFIAEKVGSAIRQNFIPLKGSNNLKSKGAKNLKTKKISSKDTNNQKKYRSYIRLSFYVLLTMLLLFIAHRGYLSDTDNVIFALSFTILLFLPILELFRPVNYSILDFLLLIILAFRLDSEFAQNGEKVFGDISNLSFENPIIGFLQGFLMIGLTTELFQFSIFSQNLKKADFELVQEYYLDPSIDRKKRILWDLFNFVIPLLPILIFPFVPNKENAPKWVSVTWFATAFLSFFFPLLLVTYRNKLEQPKVRILFRSLETLASVILLSCGVLYILYGFNFIGLIAETISYYSPSISRTVSTWLSNLVGYALSGIVGNVAYDLIKKAINQVMDSRKNNDNHDKSSSQKSKKSKQK